MEIARIKEIKNIGKFVNFKGGELKFEKITFIYAFNTFGKTTLVDIFRSFQENDPQIIEKRKTIQEDLKSMPKVVFSIKEQHETEIKFENNKWNKLRVGSEYLEIFDENFIYRNLFTGFEIKRENKENFTQFILGMQGVKIAQEIKIKKKELGEMKKSLKNQIPSFVKDKPEKEIEEFLNFNVEETKESIEQNLLQKKKEKERIQEPWRILQLKEPKDFIVPNEKATDLLKSINILFQKDYSNIKEDVLKKFNQHLCDNFTTQGNKENWIQKGLEYCKDKENGYCPFCGQSLVNAKELISIYTSYFDREYGDFVNKVEKNIKNMIVEFENINFSGKTIAQEALIKTFHFKDIINDQEFQEKLLEVQSKLEVLSENNLNILKKEILEKVKLSSEEKNKYPHKKIDIVDFSKFKIALDEYLKLLEDIKKINSLLLLKIKEFKASYKTTEINSLLKDIECLNFKLARINQNQECEAYKKLKEKVISSESEITTLENKLQEEQSIYLDDYFSEINKLFKKFGSENFTLEKMADKHGHLPVYSLKIKLHDVEIPNDKLKSVFSESDKRALALAIFWAKINLKEKSEKEKNIIILDDPITSFDENRITNTISLFKDTMHQISQLIILTHYPNFIKRFSQIAKDIPSTKKYLGIEQNNKTSLLVPCNENIFTMSEYEKTFEEIYGFINRLHQRCIKKDLRPFLENLYLPAVFAKQIRDKKIKHNICLEKKIDEIFIDEDDVKAKFHEFRKTLNPDAHIFTSNNDEDVRNLAKDMMDYLYSFKFKND